MQKYLRSMVMENQLVHQHIKLLKVTWNCANRSRVFLSIIVWKKGFLPIFQFITILWFVLSRIFTHFMSSSARV